MPPRPKPRPHYYTPLVLRVDRSPPTFQTCSRTLLLACAPRPALSVPPGPPAPGRPPSCRLQLLHLLQLEDVPDEDGDGYGDWPESYTTDIFSSPAIYPYTVRSRKAALVYYNSRSHLLGRPLCHPLRTYSPQPWKKGELI